MKSLESMKGMKGRGPAGKGSMEAPRPGDSESGSISWGTRQTSNPWRLEPAERSPAPARRGSTAGAGSRWQTY